LQLGVDAARRFELEGAGPGDDRALDALSRQQVAGPPGFVGGLVIAWRLSGAALGVSGRARTSRRLWKALQNASSTSLTEIPGGKKQNIYNLPPQPGKRQRLL
jgi:hypothetical protein